LSSIAPQVWGKFYIYMGVRYISADEHTTNIERVLCVYCVYRALVHCAPHVFRIFLASFWHARLCVKFCAQFWTSSKLCTELDARKRMVMNQKRWCSAFDERVTNDDKQWRTNHFSARCSCVLHAFTWCDWAL